MTDLETASAKALAEVQALESALDHAFAALAALDGQVDPLQEELEEHWTALQERFATLVDSASGSHGQLHQRGGDALAALDQLKAAAAELETRGEPLLVVAKATVGLLEPQAAALEPVTTQRVEEMESRTALVVEGARQAEGELRASLAQAHAFLVNEVTQALSARREDVRRLSEEAVAGIQEGTGEVHRKSLDFGSKMAEALALVQGGFLAAQQHVTDVVEHTSDSCARRHQEAVEGLAELAEELLPWLKALEEAAVRCRSDVEKPSRGLEAEVRQTAARLSAAASGLDGMRDLMRRYGFAW
jgi:hypothetical protein